MDNCNGYDGASNTLKNLSAENVHDIILIDYLTPNSSDVFIHDHVWPMLFHAICKMDMQYVLTYVAVHPNNEPFIVKPPIVHERNLLFPTHKVMNRQMLEESTESDEIANLSWIPFIRCLHSALVHLKLFPR